MKEVQVTLFGACSNLRNAKTLVEDSDDAALKSYFRNSRRAGVGADDEHRAHNIMSDNVPRGHMR